MGGTKEQAGPRRNRHRTYIFWVAGHIETWLARATLSAIARLAIVHRAILTRLRASRLVCGETHCANRGCQDREQDFEITSHELPSLATIMKASQKEEG
jgi:hypothetical protein